MAEKKRPLHLFDGTLRVNHASWLFPFVLVFCLVIKPVPAPAQTLGIAAVVNDDVISLYDLDSRIRLLIVTSKQKDTPEVRRRLARQVLNRLIDEKLKLQEAQRLNIKVSKKELDQAFENMERRNKLPKGGLSAFLRQKQIDHVVLIDQIEASLAWGAAVNRTFRSQISISEEEIDEVINEIRESKGHPEYLVSEIFLAVSNPTLANQTLMNANRLIEQINQGANFFALARNYSQSATAAIGGSLEWVRQGQLAKELNEVLAPLKKGTVSTPIRTIAGYHILLKRNERIGQGLPQSEEKLDLRQIFLPLSPNASNDEKNQLEEKARSMGARAASCSDMETLEAESGSPLSGALGVVNSTSLPAPVQGALKGLPVGTASKPLPSDGGVIFLMICKRTGTSAMDIIRPKTRQRLMSERLDISSRGLLRDLRNAAFLDIRI